MGTPNRLDDGISQSCVSSARLIYSHEDEDSAALRFWIFSLAILASITVVQIYINPTCSISRYDSSANDSLFVGEFARRLLQNFTNLGPRSTGSINNEVTAAKFLRDELEGVRDLSKSSELVAELQEHLSAPSAYAYDHFILSYNKIRNFVLWLRDTRVERHAVRHPTFLVNCHFDTFMTSPGASDAFAGCAIMVEVARALVERKAELKNDLVFLFNGAEEMVLPASHAFITQHSWSRNISAFLNLEGAGAGGRMMVFQSGPGNSTHFLIDDYYKSFKMPYGSVISEDVFQSGLIPSDTDFRIFRDYGGLPGLDMAYVSNGYAYHTPYDHECRVLQKCFVKTGADIARFILNVANDDRLAHSKRFLQSSLPNINMVKIDNMKEPFNSSVDRYVYFDVFGYSFIMVRWALWKWFNIVLLVSVLIKVVHTYCFSFYNLASICVALCLQVIAQLSGLLVVYAVGFCNHNFGVRMSWYTSRYNLIGGFIFPVLLWYVLFFTKLCRIGDGLLFRGRTFTRLFHRLGWTDEHNIPRPIRIEYDFFHSGIILLSFHLLVMTKYNLPSSFIFSLWVIGPIAGRFFADRFSAYLDFPSRYLLFVLLPMYTFHSYFCATFFDFFIPIFGRAGNLVKPDIIIGLCVAVLIFPVVVLLVGILSSTSSAKSKTLRRILFNASVSYAVLLHASRYGFPYNIASNSSITDPNFVPSLQRVLFVHTNQYTRDALQSDRMTDFKSFMWTIPLDANGVDYLKEVPIDCHDSPWFSRSYANLVRNQCSTGLYELNNATPFNCDYSLPYCGFSSFFPAQHWFSHLYRVEAPPHTSGPSASLILQDQMRLRKSESTYSNWNLTFQVNSGPPKVVILIRLNTPQVSLLQASFPLSHQSIPASQNGTDIGQHYYISHINADAYGTRGVKWDTPWLFWLIVRVEDSAPSRYIDITLSSLFTDPMLPSSSSSYLRDVHSRLPPWTVVMSACATDERSRFYF